MKSLKFKKLNISDADVLSKLQMKKITGGHDERGCKDIGTVCHKYTDEEGEHVATCIDQCCCSLDEYNLVCVNNGG
jgi:natural product precursor